MAFDLKYIGHSGFEINLPDERKSILIDPYLEINKSYNYTNLDITDIFLTHGHSDHIGSSIEISYDKQSIITAVYELANYCFQRGADTRGVNLGNWLEYSWGKAIFVPATHSNSSPNGFYAGIAAGIVFDIRGIRIYHAGDTGLFSDMKLIRELYKPDIVILPIGGTFTMDIEHAAIAAEWLQGTITIPMHYNTFDEIRVDAERFRMLLETKGLNCQIMRQNEVLPF